MKKLFSFLFVALFSVSMFAATETTVYCAISDATLGENSLKVDVKLQGDADNWERNKQTIKTGITYGGVPVYSCSFTDLYDGLGELQFHYGTDPKVSKSAFTSWTSASAYNHKIYVFATGELVDLPDGIDFYITGTAVGGWYGNEVPVDGTSYTIKGLAAGTEYKLKITPDGTWSTPKGFENLLASSVVSGIYGDNSGDCNICFKLETAGDVTVTYNDSKISLTGDFTEEAISLRGYTSWDAGDDLEFSVAGNGLTATYELVVSGLTDITYPQFKLIRKGSEFYSDGKMLSRDRETSDVLDINSSDNMSLKQDVNATYILTYTYATRKLAVTPFPALPAMKYYVYGNFVEGEVWSEQEMEETDGVWSANFAPSYARAQYQFLIKRTQGFYLAYYGAQDADNDMKEGNSTDWSLTYTDGKNIKMTPNNKAGNYTFNFEPDGGTGTLSVVYPSGTVGINNTEVSGKAVKTFENGQLVIIKNGVKYNALGAEIK